MRKVSARKTSLDAEEEARAAAELTDFIGDVEAKTSEWDGWPPFEFSGLSRIDRDQAYGRCERSVYAQRPPR